MTGDPLFTAGSNVMIAFCGPGVTTTLVGGLGTVAGVTGADGADGDDEPVELLAVAVNV